MIALKKWTVIHFIKIDTQGTDFECLISAGEYLQNILSGVIEVPYTIDDALYQQSMDLNSAIRELERNNFVIARVVPNGGGECNLFFYKKDFGIENYLKLERDLHFSESVILKIDPGFTYRDLVRKLYEKSINRIRNILANSN